MLQTPQTIRRLGIGQFVFATLFVIWLLWVPNGGETFAWPVTPRLSAVFIGTSFILRAVLGLVILRTAEWYRIRWVEWGNFAFLALILVATFWHALEMNWASNILLAHVWVIIYIFEPLILPFLRPTREAASTPLPVERSEGPVQRELRWALIAIVMVGTTVAGLLFINPSFITLRWPWSLDPFDARIMAAWPGAVAVWAGTMAQLKDWAEIKLGVRSLILYNSLLFAAWLITLPQYDMSRPNVWTYGILTGFSALLLIYFHWRHAQRGMAVMAQAGYRPH